jgi:hypothetical protein
MRCFGLGVFGEASFVEIVTCVLSIRYEAQPLGQGEAKFCLLYPQRKAESQTRRGPRGDVGVSNFFPF